MLHGFCTARRWGAAGHAIGGSKRGLRVWIFKTLSGLTLALMTWSRDLGYASSMIGSEAALQCARCSTAIAEDGAYWTEDGRICASCESREILQTSFLKAYQSAGYGSLGAGVVGFLFNPFFAFTIIAISSASWAIKSAATQDPVERAVARKHRGPVVAGGLGMCLGVLHIVVRVLASLPS